MSHAMTTAHVLTKDAEANLLAKLKQARDTAQHIAKTTKDAGQHGRVSRLVVILNTAIEEAEGERQ